MRCISCIHWSGYSLLLLSIILTSFSSLCFLCAFSFFFFFIDPAPTEIYPLSLHDALPISEDNNDLHQSTRAEIHYAEAGRAAVPGRALGPRPHRGGHGLLARGGRFRGATDWRRCGRAEIGRAHV